MILTIDFETRSTANLSRLGAFAYAAHKDTEVMALAVAIDDNSPKIYIPEKFRRLVDTELSEDEVKSLLTEAETVVAHNAMFEFAMLRYCLLWNIPSLIERLACTAATAAAAGMPRGLGHVSKILRLGGKDSAGQESMRLLTAPERRTKVFMEDHTNKTHLDLWASMVEYCRQDVKLEREIYKRLPRLPKRERILYALDLIINDRGIPIDRKSILKLMDLCDKAKDGIKEEFRRLTGFYGQAMNPTQTQKFLRFLQSRFDLDIDSLAAAEITTLLESDSLINFAEKEESQDVRRLLELRLQYAKSSTSKFIPMLEMANTDDRLRGCLVYYGTSTGRWSGKGFQPQTLPSRGLAVEAKDHGAVLTYLDKPDYIQTHFGPILDVASAMIRPMVRAPEGKEFICADYSAIEGRGLAWLAGETKVLEAYENGEDLYIKAASAVFGVPESEVTKEQRAVGKVLELACGYQGGYRALLNMASGYNIEMSELEAQELVPKWRDSRHLTKALWHNTERAARDAVENPGAVFPSGKLRFVVQGDWLLMKLPSGRSLYYLRPKIEDMEMPFTDNYGNQGVKNGLTYEGRDSSRSMAWGRKATYGGKLVANAVQAICRDVFTGGLYRLSEAGWHVVLHVHDEILAEEPIGTKTLDEMLSILSIAPGWAKDFPVAAAGWVGERYRK